MTHRCQELIRVVQSGPIALVLLNRPERRNALNRDMWRALPEIADDINRREDVRLAVLTSSSRGIFSAGADLKEYRDHLDDPDWGEEGQRLTAAAMDAINNMSVPTLAAIDGACSGGAVGLAAACDVRIATARSTFAVTPARLATVYPFRGIVYLVDLAGVPNAKKILFTGATFDAHEAATLGLVDEVVDYSQLDVAVVGFMDALTGTSRTSVRLMKQAIRLVASGHRSADDVTDSFVREAMRSKDYHEGVSAFLDGRRPTFGN